MNNEEVIRAYKEQEKMMVLIYAQWCVNNNFDCVELYEEAYPEQVDHSILKEVIHETVSKKESEEITDDVLFSVLGTFGNTDLIFVIQERLEKRKRDEQLHSKQ